MAERTGFRSLTLNLLRFGAGLLFMQHGSQKLFGLLGGMGPTGGHAELLSLMGLAGILEFFGGLLIAIGLFTRYVAPILFLEMVIAYVKAHLPRGTWPILNHGELAALYALIFLVLAAFGPGQISVDGFLRRGRRTRGL